MADETICPKCSAQNPKDTVFCGKCGTKIPQTTAEREAVDPLIGSFVGDRFLVHEKLGEGGMGVVYRAEQTAIKREVALKVLHANLNDDSLFARFQNEAAAASRLNHPNTITIYDFGKTKSSSLYIAMEFVKGTSLDDEIMRTGAMPVARVCQIAFQICGSLQDAHDNNIVHRDLKPENVMLCERAGEKDVVKVLDFGIAKILEDDGQDQRKALTKTGMVFGTPQYMSPEQIRGEKVDHRSDIYSLGIMMYQMLTGSLPFSADTPMGLLTKHLMDTPRPLEPQGVPAEIADVVMATLEKEASKRPSSMKELANRISAASGVTMGMAVGRTQAGKASAATQPQSSVNDTMPSPTPVRVDRDPRKPFPMVLAAVVALLLIGGGAAAWFVLNGGAQSNGSQTTPTPQTPALMAPPAQPTALSQLTQQQQDLQQQVPPASTIVPQPQPEQPAVNAQPAAPATVETPKKETPSKHTKNVSSKKPDEKQPEETPGKEEKTEPTPETTAPAKDTKCRFTTVGASDDVAKSVLKALRGRESAIKACTDKTPEVNAMMQYTIPKNSNKLSRIRAVLGKVPNACVTNQLKSVTISPNAESTSTGTVGVRLKKTGNVMVDCIVSVTSNSGLSSILKGGLKSK